MANRACAEIARRVIRHFKTRQVYLKHSARMLPQPHSHVANPLGGEHGSNEEGGSRGIQPLAAADVSPSAAFMKSRMAFR